MPRRYIYSEINLHMTWHVKNDLPVLTDKIEDRLQHYLKHYVIGAKGVTFHEVGGTETHVHLAVSVPPTLLLSEWIG